MDFKFEAIAIEQLFELVDKNKIDLNPSYQRNFIWSPVNQKELIDTILHGYPLPAFFVYEKTDGSYEMVDGQQRTKTIYHFIKGLITSSKKFNNISFDGVDKKKFLSYKLPVIFIQNLSGNDSLKEFYVLINKKGVHLNTAEVNKSEFHDTKFLKLANEVLTYQNLIDLNLFTDATAKRMNDRAFVEELLGYLIIGDSKDKKKAVTDLYSVDITDGEYKIFKQKFERNIDKIHRLNAIHPINETRYRQKNDFYTLFSFVYLSEDTPEILDYQYRVLLVLDRHDSYGRQFIRPSNDDSVALKEYANNCITQSNSKNARDKRLKFFNSLLKNQDVTKNETLTDVIDFLCIVYGENRVALKKIGDYELIDVDLL